MSSTRRGRIGPIRLAAIGVAVAVFGTCAVVLVFGGASAKVAPIIGQVAPDIQGQTVAGDRVHLGEARGRWVLVNFFAPWCTACVMEHPEIEKFAQRHQDVNDARVVSVVVDTSMSDIKAFIDRRSPTWPFVIDDEGGTAVAYGRLKVPESYLVAPNGIVVTKFSGAVTADDIERSMRGLDD